MGWESVCDGSFWRCLESDVMDGSLVSQVMRQGEDQVACHQLGCKVGQTTRITKPE